jgi:hypothetical protein
MSKTIRPSLNNFIFNDLDIKPTIPSTPKMKQSTKSYLSTDTYLRKIESKFN